MSGLILPGDQEADAPKTIGRRLLPLAVLQGFCGMRVHLRNPTPDFPMYLGDAGYAGILVSIVPLEIYPKRAKMIVLLPPTPVPTLTHGMILADLLEKCDPWVVAPGSMTFESMLEKSESTQSPTL